MRKNKKNNKRLRKVNARMLKTASKFLMCLSVVLGAYFVILYAPFSVSADETTTFQVNVVETLSVSVTTPDSSHWASGTPTSSSATDFLRNTVSLNIATNNTTGFTAMMYADTSADNHTSLINTTKSSETLPTLLESSTRGSFPANYWGYSLNTTGDTTSNTTYNGKIYNETTAGDSSSYYHSLPTSSAPATVLTSDEGATRDIYFGAKADISQASGTYAGTVIISVVTGLVNDNNDSNDPVTPPDNPATDNDTSGSGTNPTYAETYGSSGTSGWTVYTSTSSGTDTETTTTQVSDGDVRSIYPLGATEKTTSNIETKSALATGLAITATTVAASGAFFFVAAKRREDDDEE